MKKNDLTEMRSYLLLWFTQMLSGLGSAMTSYALVIWSYTQQGSALATALLMVCSYAPYVIFSAAACQRGGHHHAAASQTLSAGGWSAVFQQFPPRH